MTQLWTDEQINGVTPLMWRISPESARYQLQTMRNQYEAERAALKRENALLREWLRGECSIVDVEIDEWLQSHNDDGRTYADGCAP